MRPVFFNSAFVRVPERLVLKGGAWRGVDLRVRYGLAEHPVAGPGLIDLGYGPEVTVAPGRSWLLRLYAMLTRPKLVPEGQPRAVLSAQGIAPKDINWILLTHFHADHVAALPQFPNARIYCRKTAYDAMRARGALGNLHQGVFAELIPDIANRIVDLAALDHVPTALGAGVDLFGDGSLLTIDLPGHAEGHVGALFPALDPPLLYAVDAQWMAAALEPGRIPGFPASLVPHDLRAMRDTAARVAAFRDAAGAVLLCHEPGLSPYDGETE